MAMWAWLAMTLVWCVLTVVLSAQGHELRALVACCCCLLSGWCCWEVVLGPDEVDSGES